MMRFVDPSWHEERSHTNAGVAIEEPRLRRPSSTTCLTAQPRSHCMLDEDLASVSGSGIVATTSPFEALIDITPFVGPDPGQTVFALDTARFATRPMLESWFAV